jgi:hypothetical protein
MTQLFINMFGSFTYIALVLIGMFSIWQFKKHKFIYSFIIFTVACISIQLLHNEFNPVTTVTSTEEIVVYDKESDQDVWIDDYEVRKFTDNTKSEFDLLPRMKTLRTDDFSLELSEPVKITYNDRAPMSIYTQATVNRNVRINKVIVKKVTYNSTNWRETTTNTKYEVEFNFDAVYSKN